MILDPSQHPEQDESQRCQFCVYRGKLTAEHIWPWALRRHFPEIGSAMHERGGVGRSGPVPAVTWEGPPFTATARIDCHPCNHERLERIEREAAPVFAHVARGTLPRSGIRVNAQRKLAAFALRMVAVGQYTHATQRPVPRNHREHLATNLSPPPRMEVWAFCCEQHDVFETVHLQAGAFVMARPGESFPPWPNAYRGILRFGNLVIELAARYDGSAFPAIPTDARAFMRLWPIDFNRIAVWPPDRIITEAQFERRLASFNEPETTWPQSL